MARNISLHFGGKAYSSFSFCGPSFKDFEKLVSKKIKVDVDKFVLEYTYNDRNKDYVFGDDADFKTAKAVGKTDEDGLIVKASQTGKCYASPYVSVV